MKVTYLKSACVLVEHQGVKVLADPWLVDGEYFGSWAHYPPCNFKPSDYNDVDYIYISHIHPDHFSAKTLDQMDHRIPILIHNFASKFLKNNIERLGFRVTELNHNERTHLKNGLYLNILAADNCNPSLCGKSIGCAPMEKKTGSTRIDTLAILDNDKQVIVNTNDCPFELTLSSANIIKNRYGKIDLLLVGYAGAGPYPQCFEMDSELRMNKAEAKRQQFLNQTEMYLKLFEPRYFMPFAGRYTLAGRLANLNDYRGVPELEDAYDYFVARIDQSKQTCVILDSQESFNLDDDKISKQYTRIDRQAKQEYINNVLVKRKYHYDDLKEPSDEELLEMVPKCYERFERARLEVGYSSDTRILLDLNASDFLSISCNGGGYNIVSKTNAVITIPYVRISTDRRLLKLLLQGPKYAHWNNAEIGSHLQFKREPDVFQRYLYYCLYFFHV